MEETPVATLAVVEGLSETGTAHRLIGDVECADWDRNGHLAVVRPEAGRHSEQYAPTTLEYPIGRLLYTATPQDIPSPKEVELRGLRWPLSLTNVRVSPDNRLVAAIERKQPDSADGAIVVFDSTSGKRRNLLSALSEARGLAWSADGRKLIFAAAFPGGDLSLQEVDLAGNARLRSLSGLRIPSGKLTVQDISSKDDLLLSAVKAYSLGVRSCDLHAGSGRSLFRQDFRYDSSRAEFGQDADIFLAEVADSGEPAIVVTVRSESLSSFVQRADGTTALRLDGLMATSLSPDGKSVVAVSKEGDLFVVPISAPRSRLRITPPGLRVDAARWFHDGRRLLLAANGSKGEGLYLWDSRESKPVLISRHGAALRTGGSSLFCAAISVDDKVVAAIDSNFQVAIIATDGSRESIVPGKQFYEPLRWSPDGHVLYVLDAHRTAVERVSPTTGNGEPVISLGKREVGVEPLSIEITADGRRCAYAYRSVVSQLFRVRSGAW